MNPVVIRESTSTLSSRHSLQTTEDGGKQESVVEETTRRELDRCGFGQAWLGLLAAQTGRLKSRLN